jgi:hypothetical protein
MTDQKRKDRLIQTRVPQDLESTLKDEARRRRLSVSHLIRNVLEDTFNLVDNVVVEVDRVVTDSVEMAKTFQRDAQRLAATARGQTGHRKPTASAPDEPTEGAEGEPSQEEAAEHDEPEEASDVDEAAEGTESPAEILRHVYAWQELVVHRPTQCLKCGGQLGRGERAFLAQSDRPTPRVWICQACLEQMGD